MRTFVSSELGKFGTTPVDQFAASNQLPVAPPPQTVSTAAARGASQESPVVASDNDKSAATHATVVENEMRFIFGKPAKRTNRQNRPIIIEGRRKCSRTEIAP